MSIVPVVLLLIKAGRSEQAADYLHEVLIWIVQRYRDGVGLAGATATPEAEVRQVIGRAIHKFLAFNGGKTHISRQCFLDLCAFLDQKRLYSLPEPCGPSRGCHRDRRQPERDQWRSERLFGD